MYSVYSCKNFNNGLQLMIANICMSVSITITNVNIDVTSFLKVYSAKYMCSISLSYNSKVLNSLAVHERNSSTLAFDL